MLTLAQPPIGWWPLAWAAYVPFIIAGVGDYKLFKVCLIAYIVSVIYWLGNLYWLSYVTVAGWIAFCFYTALLWPILVIGLRWCGRKKVPLILAAPILIVGIENAQGLFLGGFYWAHLSHSQYANTLITQIADIFGAAGVSFLVAMVNGAIAELFIVRRRLLNVCSVAIACAAIAGTLVYSHYRIEQTDRFVTDGPIIAAVQTNVPQSVKESFAAEQQLLNVLVRQSEQCVKSGAKLIVWPETMVQAIIEPQVLQLLDESHQYQVFNKTISNMAGQGIYILTGAYGGSPRIEENFDIRMAEKFNSAFLYTPAVSYTHLTLPTN